MLQFATSATLRRESVSELRDFAATLFSKDPEWVHVIEGISTRAEMAPSSGPSKTPSGEEISKIQWLDQPLLVADNEGNMELAEAQDLVEHLCQCLPLLTSQNPPAGESHPAVVLYETLRAAPLIHQLEDILWENRSFGAIH